MYELQHVRHAVSANKIVGPAFDVRIVFGEVIGAFLNDGHKPRLIRQPSGNIDTEIRHLARADDVGRVTGVSAAGNFLGSFGAARSLGEDRPPPRRSKGSAVVQTPEKSGLPSASRGAGANIFTPPSGLRGTPLVGYSNHCAASGTDTNDGARRRRRVLARCAKRGIAPAYINRASGKRRGGYKLSSMRAMSPQPGIE